ncbi:MAG: hypothetical protein ABSB22_12740 [Thermodesulfobacteriota bacterium]
MARTIIILILLGTIAAAACIGLWFGSWMFKLSAMKTVPYILGCFVGAPLVAVAVVVTMIVMPLAGFLAGILGREK